MTDAQFLELLHHIDGIENSIVLSGFMAAFVLFVAIACHAWTRN